MPKEKRLSAATMDQVLQACKISNQSEVARKFGTSEKTISNWRIKFNGMPAQDIKRTSHLEEENARLKRMIAKMAIDIELLKEVNTKKW